MDVRNHGREQSARVGKEKPFLTLQPELVGVPIIVGVLDLHQVAWAGAEKLQRLGGASENHATHGIGVGLIQAAAGSGSRAYSRNNPPSRSVHITSPAGTTGSDRAIGGGNPRARGGRATLW